MAEDKFAAAHIYVSGRVQGVGFRFFAINMAKKYGIRGWVKNLYDGRVEIEAEGKFPHIKLFVDHIRVGPSYAHVANLAEKWQEIRYPRYDSFTVSY
jgi:acylphosphatase